MEAESVGEAGSVMRTHCCDDMARHVSQTCPDHPDPSDCPDALVGYWPKFDEYGIVTELCTGSLKALLHAEVLPEERVWEIFLDLLNGIAHIHANGLRHLDIK